MSIVYKGNPVSFRCKSFASRYQSYEAADALNEASELIDQLEGEVDEQKAEIAKLTAKRDAWRQLVIEHNAECKRLCETYACGYRKYVERVGRHCSNCHLDYQIDIPAELEQPT